MPAPSSKPRTAKAAPAASVDAYLASAPAQQRAVLLRLRRTIKAAAPGATESISYGMATFKYRGKRLAYYAYWKDHCALYGLGTTIYITADKPLTDRALTSKIKARIAEIDRPAKS
jgi:ribose 1,5-bisphosphokinase PhnN